jgi:hypothetical protein
MQRWIADFMCDCVEAWSDWRRTNIPAMPLTEYQQMNHTGHTTYPVRFVYSSTDSERNQDQYDAAVSKYLGGNDENNQLTFDAGVVHIDGDGDYKVSVNADTKGFRFRATGNPDTEYKPKGLGFAAVIIHEGEKELPNAVITVKKVKVDGKDIELKKHGYTNTESGSIRSNIFNEWVSDDGLPGDARSDKGALFNNFSSDSPTDINDGSYSAQLVDTGAFDEWTKVEVEFTVSGLDK